MSVGQKLKRMTAENEALQAEMALMRAEHRLKMAKENIELADLRSQLAALSTRPNDGPGDEIAFTGQGYDIPKGGHINLLGGCASLSHGVCERIAERFPGVVGFSAVVTLIPLTAAMQAQEGAK